MIQGLFTQNTPLECDFERRTAMTKSEMAETLDQLTDGLEEALDPELTREELVSRVKGLSGSASGETGEEEDEEDGDEDDLE